MPTNIIRQPDHIHALAILISYDAGTGRLFWKPRPVSNFKCHNDAARWNGKHAGKEAFTYKNADGYKVGTLFGEQYRAHQVALALSLGKWPDTSIDHINGDRGDNRLCNLRLVNSVENSRNQCIRSNTKSGTLGVCWHKHSMKWRAYISTESGQKHLGTFTKKEEAIAARKSAERELSYHENHGRLA